MGLIPLVRVGGLICIAKPVRWRVSLLAPNPHSVGTPSSPEGTPKQSVVAQARAITNIARARCYKSDTWAALINTLCSLALTSAILSV